MTYPERPSHRNVGCIASEPDYGVAFPEQTHAQILKYLSVQLIKYVRYRLWHT